MTFRLFVHSPFFAEKFRVMPCPRASPYVRGASVPAKKSIGYVIVELAVPRL
jgi:hypothetical protein